MGLGGTSYFFPGQTHFYKGKVRDVYTLDESLVTIVSDRISAFDHVLPEPIPYKGQVLNQLSSLFLQESQNIVPNWFLSVPDPNVTIGQKCEPIKLEMVIRGYLAGHSWREYRDGKREVCGVKMPEGMKESDRFPQPIITPATKADEGHDEDISKDDILAKGIVSLETYKILEDYTYKLFEYGTQRAAKQGLILVDTKYEFGFNGEKIMLIDEIHTPDSSRYFYAEGYEERQSQGQKQKQLSKEFVREWLMDNGFQGKKGQNMPTMTNEIVAEISNKYIELYEAVTGEEFVKRNYDNVENDIEKSILKYLDQ